MLLKPPEGISLSVRRYLVAACIALHQKVTFCPEEIDRGFLSEGRLLLQPLP